MSNVTINVPLTEFQYVMIFSLHSRISVRYGITLICLQACLNLLFPFFCTWLRWSKLPGRGGEDGAQLTGELQGLRGDSRRPLVRGRGSHPLRQRPRPGRRRAAAGRAGSVKPSPLVPAQLLPR